MGRTSLSKIFQDTAKFCFGDSVDGTFPSGKKRPISQLSVTNRTNCTLAKSDFFHAILSMLFILRIKSLRFGSYAGNHE